MKKFIQMAVLLAFPVSDWLRVRQWQIPATDLWFHPKIHVCRPLRQAVERHTGRPRQEPHHHSERGQGVRRHSDRIHRRARPIHGHHGVEHPVQVQHHGAKPRRRNPKGERHLQSGEFHKR